MNIEIIQDLYVRRFPYDHPTPWLTGRGPRWELIQPFIVAVDGEIHEVEAGFVFDGATVPWWLWWLYPPSYPPSWRASCLHDKGLSCRWKGKPQEYWDEVLRQMMLFDGALSKDADRFHWAVGLSPRGAYQ